MYKFSSILFLFLTFSFDLYIRVDDLDFVQIVPSSWFWVLSLVNSFVMMI
jgi:hypothetical protein